MASYQPLDPTQPDGVAYGSGMLRAVGYYGHAGLIFGYNTQFLRDPQTDTTIVVLTGLTLAPDGRLPVEPLVAAVIDQL
jgi:D-alanyl-D-alanine carboxypeptidase